MKIFDTHAHYDDEAFDKDRDELLTSLFSGDIGAVVNVGASLEGCIESVRLAEKYDNIYAAIGVHPDDYERLERGESFMDWLKKEALTNNKVVAIGEIGLDYHYLDNPKEVQKMWFETQIEAAVDVNKPIIVHSREACADTIQCMKNKRADKAGGVIHCYSYTKEAAKEFLDMGFFIGVGGVVTFKNARKLVETVEEVPVTRIVLETDCPYMAPEPHRGTRNDSRNIRYVAEKIAQIKGITAQEVIDITNENAKKLFF